MVIYVFTYYTNNNRVYFHMVILNDIADVYNISGVFIEWIIIIICLYSKVMFMI